MNVNNQNNKVIEIVKNLINPYEVMEFIGSNLIFPKEKELLILILDIKLNVLNYIYIKENFNFKSILKMIYCPKGLNIIICHHQYKKIKELVNCFEIIGFKVIDIFSILKNQVLRSDITNNYKKIINNVKRNIVFNKLKIDFELDLKIKNNLEKLFLNKLFNQEKIIESLIVNCQFLGQEIFGIIILDKDNKIFKIEIIFKGGLSSSIVDLKVLIKYFLLNKTKRVLFFHNHPSGDVMPSFEDIDVTKKIKRCCDLLKIDLIAHLIIGFNSEKDILKFI